MSEELAQKLANGKITSPDPATQRHGAERDANPFLKGLHIVVCVSLGFIAGVAISILGERVCIDDDVFLCHDCSRRINKKIKIV